MERKFLEMTLYEAMREEPKILEALEGAPVLSTKIGTLMKQGAPSNGGPSLFEAEKLHDFFKRMPWNAVVVGQAADDDGYRVGVWGSSVTNIGVYAESAQDIGLYAKGGRLAAQFDGNVEVSGDIKLTGSADCAEDFDICGEEPIEPGTVMVLCDEGTLRPSHLEYDKRVAGVISGAGDFKPGIVLDKQCSTRNRAPVALLGKAYCKVDARYGAIEIGDLLTTSPTFGRAMKASDPLRAFGAVIGKALQPLREGQQLIPVLVALQ